MSYPVHLLVCVMWYEIVHTTVCPLCIDFTFWHLPSYFICSFCLCWWGWCPHQRRTPVINNTSALCIIAIFCLHLLSIIHKFVTCNIGCTHNVFTLNTFMAITVCKFMFTVLCNALWLGWLLLFWRSNNSIAFSVNINRFNDESTIIYFIR